MLERRRIDRGGMTVLTLARTEKCMARRECACTASYRLQTLSVLPRRSWHPMRGQRTHEFNARRLRGGARM